MAMNRLLKLDERTMAWLRRRARETNLSMAAIVRLSLGMSHDVREGAPPKMRPNHFDINLPEGTYDGVELCGIARCFPDRDDGDGTLTPPTAECEIAWFDGEIIDESGEWKHIRIDGSELPEAAVEYLTTRAFEEYDDGNDSREYEATRDRRED